MKDRLRKLWMMWKAFARRLGDFQARLLLGVFYFLIASPFALCIRWFSDPLSLKNKTECGWRQKTIPQATPRELASRQF